MQESKVKTGGRQFSNCFVGSMPTSARFYSILTPPLQCTDRRGLQFCSVLCTMVAEKLHEFAAKEIGAAYAHGGNCIHAPAAALPWGKAALQAGGAAQGRPGLGAHWGHPANGPPLSRAQQPSGFCAGSAGLRLLLLSGRTTAESSPPGGSPLCSTLLPGTRCSAVPLDDTGQYGRYSRPRAAPGQPGRLCIHHRRPGLPRKQQLFLLEGGPYRARRHLCAAGN